MTRSRGRSVSRSLTLVLTLLLMLGHACELPAFAAVFSSVHEHGPDSSHHESPEHHGDESQLSCDALVGLPSSSDRSSGTAPDVEARAVLPVAVAIGRRVTSTAPQISRGSPGRVPLFLLHASLLI